MTHQSHISIAKRTERAVSLLRRMIATPSTSRSEEAAADLLQSHLAEMGIATQRLHNNIWALAPGYDPTRPTLMLNSHIDTVKPSPAWTSDPFEPIDLPDGAIQGLGSNDAGASVVSLIEAFDAMRMQPMPCNLLLALTAEEEVMGENGMRAFLPQIVQEGIDITMALVGEPTGMQPAVAERGLVVLDCTAHGVSGHAARNEGVNAIYIALADIERMRTLKFERESAVLGPIKISVTQIEAGTQHNVVPAECHFVADVRTTEAYTNEETAQIIAQAITSDAKPRSTRVQASVIDQSHPLVQAAIATGGVPYVSPTTSDMALMHHFPSLKMGPGESARSHTAGEMVRIDEIAAGIDGYIALLTSLKL